MALTRRPWLIALCATSVLGAVPALAQPGAGDHHPPGPPPATAGDHARRRPPPPSDGPTEAPPSPREERQAARAGFTWIAGRWDWRAGKWQWVEGKWEKERVNERWNPGHWDKRGDHWVYTEGAWIKIGPGGTVVDGPREAPPAPREERERDNPRPGFTWVSGRWDWRNGKWEWSAGRWEKNRPGKRWNAGRWDKQGDRYVWVDGDWTDAGPLPPGRPRQPPPPPREERPPTPRPGYVYQRGRWDWRNDKWEWMDGRWEKERPGQQWREARWELRDGTYALVDGEWVNVGPPGSPGTSPPIYGGDRDDRGGRRVWRLERPTASSYWPVKGKPSSRIVIHGRNFPPGTQVMWGDTPLNGARVTPNEIIVAVPANAESGTLLLKTDRGPRALIVGNFEVASDYDAAAEAARQAEAARKRAEEQWAARQRELARDRAARQAAYEAHLRQLEDTREQRRQARLAEIRAQWENAFLADPNTQDELTLHAQRSAELSRAREIAEISENGKLVIRIGVAQTREDDRHAARMKALHDAFGRTP